MAALSRKHPFWTVVTLAVVALAVALGWSYAGANRLNLQTLRRLAPAIVASPQPSLTDFAARMALDGAPPEAQRAQGSRARQEAMVRSALARGEIDTGLRLAAPLEPLRCDLAMHMASSLLLQSDEAGARRFWAMCPGIVFWLNQQGDQALDAGNSAEARAWFARAAALPPGEHDTSLALLRLARLEQAETGWESALPIYEEYSKLAQAQILPPLTFTMRTDRDTDMWEFVNVGHALRERDGDCSQAAFWYDLAARRAPESEIGPLYQGICAQGSEAQRVFFQRVIALNPTGDRGYYWTGITFQREENCAEAIPWFTEALLRDEANSVTHLTLARCYEAVDDGAAARTHYSRALELKPGNLEATRALERLATEPAPGATP